VRRAAQCLLVRLLLIKVAHSDLCMYGSANACSFGAHTETHAVERVACRIAGKYILQLMKQNVLPRDIMTRVAFENAMTIVIATGGSTNAVLHLIAMAHSVGIALSLEDFQRVSDRVPFLADLKPSGRCAPLAHLCLPAHASLLLWQALSALLIDHHLAQRLHPLQEPGGQAWRNHALRDLSCPAHVSTIHSSGCPTRHGHS
jgi:dihydroxyacid dehydratase/phosphogluconate dehydratase